MKTFTEVCSEIEKSILENYHTDNENSLPITDGIVNIKNYLKAKYKILWILKEPYDEDDGTGGGWSLCRDFLATTDFYKRIGRSRKTWHPIIYVSYGILNGFLRYSDMDSIRNDPRMVNVIKDIAVINIKKNPGFTRVYNYSNIWNAYQKNKEILLLQLKTYKPDIIIGGSTLHYFLEDLGVSVSTGFPYFIKDAKIFINAYHPAQTQTRTEVYVDSIIDLAEKWAESKML